jgi:hypothetical protein
MVPFPCSSGNPGCCGWDTRASFGLGNGTWGQTAYEGNYLLDLDGSEPGTISVNIPTAEGVTYKLSFAYARNPDSIDGGIFEEPAHVPAADVLIDDVQAIELVADSNNSWTDLQWQQESYTFTATSSLTKLTLKSLDVSTSVSGILFDAMHLDGL